MTPLFALEDTMRIDNHKHSPATGEHGSVFIQNFRYTRQPAPTLADLVRLHVQRLAQRDRPEVLDLHLCRGRNNVPLLIQLAHRFIENSRDDPTVTVSGRPGEALAQPNPAKKTSALAISEELQVHAFGVIDPAPEAQIFF